MKTIHRVNNIDTEQNRYVCDIGWKYDFTSLPYWEGKRRSSYGYDKYFEFTNSDVLCSIYSIEEERMNTYYGFLAIFKNKSNPELLLNITDFHIYDQEIFSDSSENFIFLRFEFIKGIIKSQFPIIIIDIKNEKFCYLKTNEASRKYSISQIDSDTFNISYFEEIIKLSSQKWYNLAEIHSLSNNVFNK